MCKKQGFYMMLLKWSCLAEYVLIEQHTEMMRYKRDTGYEVSFPDKMELSVTFRDKKISFLMTQNSHMTSTPEMYDGNGKIMHNSQVCTSLPATLHL